MIDDQIDRCHWDRPIMACNEADHTQLQPPWSQAFDAVVRASEGQTRHNAWLMVFELQSEGHPCKHAPVHIHCTDPEFPKPVHFADFEFDYPGFRDECHHTKSGRRAAGLGDHAVAG